MNDTERRAHTADALAANKQDLKEHRADREKALWMIWKSLLVLMALQIAPELLVAMFGSQVSAETTELLHGLPVEIIQLIAIGVTFWFISKFVDECTTINLLYVSIIDLEKKLEKMMDGDSPYTSESVYYLKGGQIEFRRKAIRSVIFTLVVSSIVIVYTVGTWVSNEVYVIIPMVNTIVAYLIVRDIITYTLRGSSSKRRLVALQQGDAKHEQGSRLMRGIMRLLFIKDAEINHEEPRE